jgi:hypothetical protein
LQLRWPVRRLAARWKTRRLRIPTEAIRTITTKRRLRIDRPRRERHLKEWRLLRDPLLGRSSRTTATA